MPTDLTGTPTSLGIGTYNVDNDAPSGLGFNEAMAQIDALLVARTVQITSVFGRTGAVVAQTGDYSASEVANAADLSSASNQVFTGAVVAPSIQANQTGVTGAFVGATNSGAPSTGTWAAGQFVIDKTGAIWVCTAGGTPGTWKTVSAVTSVFGRTGAVTAQTGDYTAAQVTGAADKNSASEQDFTAVVQAPNFYGVGPTSPTGTAGGGTFTPQAGSMTNWCSTIGINPGGFTIANPAGVAGGTTKVALMVITITNNSTNSGAPTLTWDTAYRFGGHSSQPGTMAVGQSYTWLFLIDMPQSRVICVGDSGGLWS